MTADHTTTPPDDELRRDEDPTATLQSGPAAALTCETGQSMCKQRLQAAIADEPPSYVALEALRAHMQNPSD